MAIQLHRPLRFRGERRQPLPQDHVPGRQPGQAGALAEGAASRSGRTSRAAWRAAPSTRRAWRRASAIIVRDGVLEGYFLGSYSARKLGMQTTGSAGGHHNLVLRPGKHGLPRPAARDGTRAARHRAARPRREPGDRRLLARRRRLLGRGRRDPLSGRGDHHRRQPARHVPRRRARSAPTCWCAAAARPARS